MGDVEPVPMVERLAYVVREWENSHALFQHPIINDRANNPETGQPWDPIKTECECQLCKDSRVVLEEYDARGGDDRAEQVR